MPAYNFQARFADDVRSGKKSQTIRAVRKEKKLIEAFEDALNVRPHLWFEVGYTRPTGWMVHVWDKTGGGDKKIIEVQHPNRKKAFSKATKKLNKFTANHYKVI